MVSSNKITKEVLIMNKKKLTQKDKILIGVLIALIIIVIGVGAFLIVSNTNSANEQAAKLTSSGSSDSEVTASSKSSSKGTGSDINSSSEKSGNSSSSDSNSSPSADAGANTSSKTSSKTTSSKTSSKSTTKGDKVKRETPTENTSHASSKTLKVNGKTCYVGDTITVVLNITSQKTIVNYQGALSFDKKYLKLKDVKSNDFGVANFNGTDILYNASSINGMNFSETGTIFTATFEVKATGSTKVKNDLEIISELVNNSIKQLSNSDYKATVEIYS